MTDTHDPRNAGPNAADDDTGTHDSGATDGTPPGGEAGSSEDGTSDPGRAALRADLAQLDADMFRPWLDTDFDAVTADGTRVPLRLEQVSENPRGTIKGSPRTAFSLLLRGDWSLMLQDGFYRLIHPEAGDFGALNLSVVTPPRGHLDDRAAYQIVFN